MTKRKFTNCDNAQSIEYRKKIIPFEDNQYNLEFHIFYNTYYLDLEKNNYDINILIYKSDDDYCFQYAQGLYQLKFTDYNKNTLLLCNVVHNSLNPKMLNNNFVQTFKDLGNYFEFPLIKAKGEYKNVLKKIIEIYKMNENTQMLQ